MELHRSVRRGRGGNWTSLCDCALAMHNVARSATAQTVPFTFFHSSLYTQHSACSVPSA